MVPPGSAVEIYGAPLYRHRRFIRACAAHTCHPRAYLLTSYHVGVVVSFESERGREVITATFKPTARKRFPTSFGEKRRAKSSERRAVALRTARCSCALSTLRLSFHANIIFPRPERRGREKTFRADVLLILAKVGGADSFFEHFPLDFHIGGISTETRREMRRVAY